MKKLKLLVAFVGLLSVANIAHAEDVTAAGPGPAPVFLPATQNVYYHIGSLNLTVPWQNVNVVYLYDFNGKRSLMGGESVVATLWRLQGTVGAVTDIDGNGSPFVGGNLWFDNPVPQLAILNQVKPGVFGGYDWNRGASIFGIKAAMPLFQ